MFYFKSQISGERSQDHWSSVSCLAIWMVPRPYKYGGWPASGEIDIMESRGMYLIILFKFTIGPLVFLFSHLVVAKAL